MKFDVDAINKDFPHHSEEFAAFLKLDIPSGQEDFEEHEAKYHKYDEEWRAAVAAWKERHKDYFDYVKAMNERRDEACKTCANCVPKEQNCCLFVLRELKCAVGCTPRENGFCKKHSPRAERFEWAKEEGED